MKGIILAGDSGNRLHPIPLGVPKQLLPIYDKPMIYYPLETLLKSGINDILIITTSEYLPLFRKALDDGSSYSANFEYACQDNPEGIAQTIEICKDFIGDQHVCLITGDTIIGGGNFESQLNKAIKAAEKSANATIFVDRDLDPNQYGKVLLDSNGRFGSIVGNTNDQNYYSITGIYVFPNSVVQYVKGMQMSERELYEITTVNQFFQ